MDVHIEHEGYERAILELAVSRGLSVSDAIGIAVCAELERDLDQKRRVAFLERVKEAQAIFAAASTQDTRTPEEIIGYDEHGLPK